MIKRPFIGIFVVFLLIGCFSVIQENQLGMVEKQAEGQIEGVVFDIVEKANTTQLHLKDCIFYDEAEKKSYPVGNILIYYSKKFNQNSNQKIYQNSNYNSENSSNSSSNNILNSNQEIRIGNRIQVSGSLENFQKPTNQGQFDEWFYYRSRQYQYKFYGDEVWILDSSVWKIPEILRELRAKLAAVYEEHLSSEEAGVVKAMVLGEKSGLLEEIKNLYQQNGISHLMAISGLHISMLGMGFYHILEKAGTPKKINCIVAIVFIWLYGLMTGFSISTNRAVVMLMLSLIAGIVGRTYDMATALAVSGTIILMQKPMLCFDCGFLLSFGAIIGIGFFNPLLENVLELEEFLKPEKSTKSKYSDVKSAIRIMTVSIMKSLLASLSVQIVTLPVILYFYFEIPVYGVFLNIFVIPLMSILLGMAIFGGIAGMLVPTVPFLSRFFLGSVHVILNIYEKSGEVFGALPYSRIVIGKPEIWQIVVYYGLLALVGGALYLLVYEEDKVWQMLHGKGTKGSRRTEAKSGLPDTASIIEKLWIGWKKVSGWCKAGICLVLFVGFSVILVPVENWNIKSLEITFIDVGQGDSIFLKNGNGMTCLIDGGSTDESSVGTYRIMPFLKSKGVGELDYVLVTHADSDHMNGVMELLEKSKKGGVKINNLVLPKTSLIEENYEKLVTLAEENQIPVIYIKAGDRLADGELQMTCLHPATDFVPENTNSYSMVLEVEYGSFKGLLTGDLEENGEDALLESGSLEDIFLLKAAHHGSKYSGCEEFLEQVKPELAVISCGKDNSYGHPHKETLERLENVGSKIMSTAECGGITIKVEGGTVKVYGYAE